MSKRELTEHTCTAAMRASTPPSRSLKLPNDPSLRTALLPDSFQGTPVWGNVKEIPELGWAGQGTSYPPGEDTGRAQPMHYVRLTEGRQRVVGRNCPIADMRSCWAGPSCRVPLIPLMPPLTPPLALPTRQRSCRPKPPPDSGFRSGGVGVPNAVQGVSI